MDPKDNIFNRPEKDLANAMRRIDLVNQALQPFNSIQTTYNLINRLQMQQWYVEKWTEPYTNLMKQLNLSNNLANNVTNYMDNINRLRQSLNDIIPLNVIETLNGYETLRSSIERSFVSFDPEKRNEVLKKSLFDLDGCFEDLSNSETEDDFEACNEKAEVAKQSLLDALGLTSEDINEIDGSIHIHIKNLTINYANEEKPSLIGKLKKYGKTIYSCLSSILIILNIIEFILNQL